VAVGANQARVSRTRLVLIAGSPQDQGHGLTTPPPATMGDGWGGGEGGCYDRNNWFLLAPKPVWRKDGQARPAAACTAHSVQNVSDPNFIYKHILQISGLFYHF
jgi:hypothetical protein